VQGGSVGGSSAGSITAGGSPTSISGRSVDVDVLVCTPMDAEDRKPADGDDNHHLGRLSVEAGLAAAASSAGLHPALAAHLRGDLGFAFSGAHGGCVTAVMLPALWCSTQAQPRGQPARCTMLAAPRELRVSGRGSRSRRPPPSCAASRPARRPIQTRPPSRLLMPAVPCPTPAPRLPACRRRIPLHLLYRRVPGPDGPGGAGPPEPAVGRVLRGPDMRVCGLQHGLGPGHPPDQGHGSSLQVRNWWEAGGDLPAAGGPA